MISIKDKMLEYNIEPTGIIHVGAHMCQELDEYIDIGFKKIVFVEANPEIYDKIKHISNQFPYVIIANCAIYDTDGPIDFNVTSFDQSSSILPLKKHLDYYPSIVPDKTIQVHAMTLDSLVAALKLCPQDFNVLYMDIQGAELKALAGAKDLLRNIAMVYTEVNFEELYEGCAIYDDLNSFLETNHFKQIAVSIADVESWGDAIYISDRIIQCSTIGVNGRFANQLFQYMFLRTYAHKFNLKHETSLWIGHSIFDIPYYPVTRKLDVIEHPSNTLEENDILLSELVNKDLFGYFQFHTSYYAPHKDYILDLFKLNENIESLYSNVFDNIVKDKTLIVLHMRMGDYGFDDFFITPLKWYCDLLDKILLTIENPLIYIASDDKEIYREFLQYNIITSRSFPAIMPTVQYFTDFYALLHAKYLLISNSSFSFAASMLNKNLIKAYRPDPSINIMKMVSYDPWNSDVILKNVDQSIHEVSSRSNKDSYLNKDSDQIQSIQETRNLHIGGTEYHPAWEILNLSNNNTVDHVGDGGNLYKFEDNTFDKMYASHVLEHFDHLKINDVLKEWYRVLKPGGMIYISVPDVSVITALIARSNNYNEQRFLMNMIFGGHVDKNDYHQSGFTRIILSDELKEAGFTHISFTKKFSIFQDTSSMRHKDVLISLNVIAGKQHV